MNWFHGPQKTGPRWSGSVPSISGSVPDWLWSTIACFRGKKLHWTRPVNTKNKHILLPDLLLQNVWPIPSQIHSLVSLLEKIMPYYIGSWSAQGQGKNLTWVFLFNPGAPLCWVDTFFKYSLLLVLLLLTKSADSNSVS